MEAEIQNPFLQLLSLGFFWVFFHCSAMCGPIVAGLQLGTGLRLGAIQGLLLYQLGRAIVYSFFGAMAGWAGSRLPISGGYLGWVVFGILVLMTYLQFFPLKGDLRVPSALMSAWQWLAKQFQGSLRPFFLGMVLAFLPCMLAFWVLGLSAATQDPFRGALLMVMLVGMTTLPLLVVSFGGQWIFRTKKIRWNAWLLLLSCLWTLLVVLASQKTISHLHFVFDLFGRKYMMMFW